MAVMRPATEPMMTRAVLRPLLPPVGGGGAARHASVQFSGMQGGGDGHGGQAQQTWTTVPVPVPFAGLLSPVLFAGL